MDSIKEVLFNKKEPNNISSSEVIELYKIYLESINKTTDRRQNANSFFLTLNTGLLAIIGFLFQKDVAPELKSLYLLLPIAGVLSGFFWLKQVISYRQLNKGKFTILSMIEEVLPLAIFKAEWIELGEGKDKNKYHQVTFLERSISILFILLYGFLFLYFGVLFLKELKTN